MDRGEAQAQLGCGDVDSADPYPNQEIFRNFRTRHANPRLAQGEVKGPVSVKYSSNYSVNYKDTAICPLVLFGKR